MSRSVIVDITIGRDDMGNVTSYTDAVVAARNASFAYTNANQLASAQSNVWGVRSWTYNAAGSRFSETATENSVTTTRNYIYPATSNRLGEIVPGDSHSSVPNTRAPV